jgi:hypothetical protein
MLTISNARWGGTIFLESYNTFVKILVRKLYSENCQFEED